MDIQSKLIRCLVGSAMAVTAVAPAWAQQTVFNKVWVRFPQGDRLIEKGADLVLDDAARKLIVKSDDKPIELKYDDLQKIVFDETTHLRGISTVERILLGIPGVALPGVASAIQTAATTTAIENAKVSDYWCYFEYKMPDGSTRPYMLAIDENSSHQAITKIQSIFGDKVKIWNFPERAQIINKKELPELKSKHNFTMDKKNHPIPELRPDKALVVVVCPPVGTKRGGNQIKIHANGHVVAVNKVGTYSFFYLDPGDYLLVSQFVNASGIQIRLEAGQDYYFVQNALPNFKTGLSRNTKEIVMYELQGAYFSNWQEKK